MVSVDIHRRTERPARAAAVNADTDCNCYHHTVSAALLLLLLPAGVVVPTATAMAVVVVVNTNTRNAGLWAVRADYSMSVAGDMSFAGAITGSDGDDGQTRSVDASVVGRNRLVGVGVSTGIGTGTSAVVASTDRFRRIRRRSVG